MKGGGVVWLVAAVMAEMFTCGCCRKPVLHKVGGSKDEGWREHYNYTQWSFRERFYVGDWLYFGFNKHLYTVLEVSKRAFDACDDNDFIKNITRGGRDVFNMTEAKHYYFMSSGGYCWHGMKLEVRVLNYINHAPSPAKNGCLPKISGSLNTSAIALAISLLSAISILTDLMF